MTHFTIQPLHWHPLYPNRPKTLTALHQPQILAFTVPRFYDFANSQKTSKLPINSPIETYHQPITCHQPFSPNALHFPIPMTHFTIQPLHWHPLYPNRPKTLTAFHQPQILAFTVPRFYDFAN
ncbi:hypothetical protein [Bartonella sp. MU37NMGALS]|uniref:hypothetical protein n=1 Tax=Bartonella sp. MU37NMGALS TaxID=3243560 RepID=UPI0035CEF246